MTSSSDEMRQEFAQVLSEARRQRHEIAEKVGTILDAWCAKNGITRAQLSARSAAAAKAESEAEAEDDL